jgi:hypothetical protein
LDDYQEFRDGSETRDFGYYFFVGFLSGNLVPSKDMIEIEICSIKLELTLLRNRINSSMSLPTLEGTICGISRFEIRCFLLGIAFNWMTIRSLGMARRHRKLTLLRNRINSSMSLPTLEGTRFPDKNQQKSSNQVEYLDLRSGVFFWG